MIIEEAIVWFLSTEGRGMTAETLAEKINLRQLHRRRDGQPVGTKQIWAVVFRYPEMFVRDGKLIRLMILSLIEEEISASLAYMLNFHYLCH